MISYITLVSQSDFMYYFIGSKSTYVINSILMLYAINIQIFPFWNFFFFPKDTLDRGGHGLVKWTVILFLKIELVLLVLQKLKLKLDQSNWLTGLTDLSFQFFFL